ncbi:ROK family protein [Dactylosporangium sp. NPDC048998]|uniref:ROK family protein n=1 Tax=Dactylosporangium sp. NPDC048998 TaxID=3363976 RepID=UPI00372135D6
MAAYLGVDVGGTKTALRLEADGHAAVESVVRWPVGGGVRHDLGVLARAVREVCAGRPVLTAVGVAMPATVDGAGRVVGWPGRPSWTGLDLGAYLRELFPTARVSWADDGDLAAVAEAAVAGRRDVVYVGVGTGVGGGIVLDGRPLPGPGRGSCELGHMVVDRAGPACDCGRRGCVQAVASGPATLRRAARGRGVGEVSAAELRQAWLDGAQWARAAVRDSADAVALAVVGVAELLGPDVAVVGGGFAVGLPGYAAVVAEHIRASARPGRPGPAVREAVLGPLSSLSGAVLLARDQLAEAQPADSD